LNWYFINEDPLTILLPLLTQHVFNVLISIYSGGRLGYDGNFSELLGFSYSCFTVLKLSVKAILALLDVLSGKTSFAAALGVGTVLGGSSIVVQAAKGDSGWAFDDGDQADQYEIDCFECCEGCGECCKACVECCDLGSERP
jgi:hypothetical protein